MRIRLVLSRRVARLVIQPALVCRAKAGEVGERSRIARVFLHCRIDQRPIRFYQRAFDSPIFRSVTGRKSPTLMFERCSVAVTLDSDNAKCCA